MSAGRWVQVADGVYARRYTELDQTLGVVIGSDRCLVVDTGRDERHGAEFAAAIRELTPLPFAVVLTHAHFDHCLGTAAFTPCEVWAHERCSVDERVLAERAEYYPEPLLSLELCDLRQEPPESTAATTLQAAPSADWRSSQPQDARLVAQTQTLRDRATLDLGGRTVYLVHPGRGHTDHDVLVHVPDAGVVFAGDLVEQGAPPSVGPDAYPREWPAALDVLLALEPSVVVPGHGDPVDTAFVREQQRELG